MKQLLPIILLGLLLASCIAVPGVGHKGEPCDDGGGCLSELTCIDDVCVVAGGLNQPCRLSGDLCDTGLQCTAGTCTDAPCTGGTYQCIGDTLQFCIQDAWSHVTDCDSGLCNAVSGHCDTPPADGDMEQDRDVDTVVDGDAEESTPEEELDWPDLDTDVTDTLDADLPEVEVEQDVDPEAEYEESGEAEADADADAEAETDAEVPCSCFVETFCCDGCHPINERAECIDDNPATDNEVCFAGECLEAPAYRWSRSLAPDVGLGGAVVTDSMLDDAGNLYITGHFRGTINLGDGPKVAGDTENVFVASYTPGGAVRYTQAFASATGDQVATCIGVDGDDGIAWVGGWFDGDFNPGGNNLLENRGGQDAFLIRLDVNGGVMWARSYGDSADNQRINDIVVDNQDDAYVVGAFQGSLNLGEFIPNIISVTTQSAFVAAMHDDGDGFWVNSIVGNDGEQEATVIGLNLAGDVIAGGAYTGTPMYKSSPFPEATSESMFVISVGVDNTGGWVNTFVSEGRDTLEGLAIAGDSSIIICGTYKNTSPFNSGTTAQGGTDPFIAELDNDFYGRVIWYRDEGSAGDDAFNDCAINAFGRIFITGYIGGAMTINGGTITPAGSGDAFTGSFTDSGGYAWTMLWGDAAAAQQGTTVSADEFGRVFVGGSFFGSMDMGNGIIDGGNTFPNGFVGAYFGDPLMNLNP